MEHRRPVSNEEEFDYWLASAFESERKRLHECVAEPTPGSYPNPTPENVSGNESKEEKGGAAAA